MSTRYKINEAAARSGFSAATLRYYEEIGLLPAPQRTAAGYRVYDEQTLDRLAFIMRAKQLGCTLEEIIDLTSAWAGGRCGPVQDRLRKVVAEKITGAQQQVVELITLTAELQQAAAALERHRPEGACDDRCGCVSDAGVEPDDSASGVALSTTAMVEAVVPTACTLGAGGMRNRMDEWRMVLAHVTRREPIRDGVRLVFDGTTPFDELMRLTAAERDCCRFFSFAITVDARGIALEVVAPTDAQPIVESMFGAAA